MRCASKPDFSLIMAIILPSAFSKKLENTHLEKALVYSAIAKVEVWLKSVGPPVFFPDYTDHGENHINSVLETTAAMMPTTALAVVSAADVVVILQAIILHDSALFLTKDGFYGLIYGGDEELRISHFDDASWPKLWDQFLFNAKRWSNEKLADIFGGDYVSLGNSVSNPFDRWSDLLLSDYKLIGEFIRENHPRLAHEFAMYGVPSVTDRISLLPENFPDAWKDIAGIVARSHGMDLRNAFDKFKERYHCRDFQGLHVAYLMALLRIGDYLQIDSGRAPSTVFQYRVLPSRISKLEWESHDSIKNITSEHDDPECVEVTVEPKNVRVFLKVQSWLRGIQSELDSSWAVLGEVYGRFENLYSLGLKWRRIRSNIDQLKQFSESVKFLPRQVRIEVARAELLSLLIRPLYGNDPTFGIRELIQNAVDAVKEKEFLIEKSSEKAAISYDKNLTVSVWLSDYDPDKSHAWLEVIDTGVGMTESVLIDYFLRAGASFRKSESWQRIFEVNVPDKITTPRSQIMRTGRFGVGALASFLLGDVVFVETRHIFSEEGYSFSMTLNDDAIEVEKVKNIPTGTRIKIKINHEVFNKLQRPHDAVAKPALWDWYLLKTPKIERYFGNERVKLGRRSKVDLSSWHEVDTPHPLQVHWKFDDELKSDTLPALSCNGIFISNAAKIPKLQSMRWGPISGTVATPFIHVTDPDGYMNLNLTRTELLSDKFIFDKELAEDIIFDFFARILSVAEDELRISSLHSTASKCPFAQKDHAVGKRGHRPTTIITDFGFAFPFSGFTKYLSIKTILWCEDVHFLKRHKALNDWDCVVIQGEQALRGESGEYFFKDFESFKRRRKSISKLFDVEHFRCTDRLVIDHEDISDKTALEAEQVSNFYVDSSNFDFLKIIENKSSNVESTSEELREEWIEWTPRRRWREDKIVKKSGRWMVETINAPSSAIEVRDSDRVINGHEFSLSFFAEIYLKAPWSDPFCVDALSYWWTYFFGEQLMPWSIEDRKRRFPEAYKKLSKWLNRYL